ncbi:preprotein translocase subunit SecB [Chromobacterium alkanivorans]|jgi:preprotein translocase subunit SecB|uniref:protein-export chaperone SecB n=1 Tax=Chromobacterium TaxID=535 RepID=UPI0006548FFD|nr:MULTISPECIES: protein-export chaperone SecB [Chromobacterium]KMN83457.1 preprotein translocase subunit SecB [Chromobacterium sp. LK11]MBN3005023.1 protein-export chaperone SecB [Chromobacterium alkanivorans]MCS3806042.1 preprotein translocase subunit SecB [Chromobacterium alkanivorans]MCS3820556.1 preprotein translocase subunit SecB [Chromobacterium alkanivorans]MCS3875314.1 preprotein translocase subunit SecB [Chromobacterium alkanivorans]
MSEQQELQPAFSIEKIYVKDMSLEVPGAPQVFLEQEQPEIDMQLASEGKQLDDGFYEVTLTVTVTAKLPEKTMFLCEVGQSGIFQIRNVPAEDIDPILGVACPNILFPYAREAVSSVVNRAGFPPVLLSPINFEALYMQQRAQQAEAGNA